MTVVLNISVKAPAPGVTIRAWREILRHAFADAGRVWHSTMLPKHFGSGARRAYPGVYKQRSRKWLMRKLRIAPSEIRRQMGPTKPGRKSQAEVDQYWEEYRRTADRIIEERGGANFLVSTGTLRNLSKLATFRAFPSRLSVQIQGTAYTPSKPRPNANGRISQPNIRAELTATTKAEQNELRIIVSKRIREGVKYFFEHGHVPAAQRQGIF
ncbi:MAG: hypothetical protein JNL58_04470 [Planctomyces sp.]|nr:hypothetical protein [Planctomyces sp.]